MTSSSELTKVSSSTNVFFEKKTSRSRKNSFTNNAIIFSTTIRLLFTSLSKSRRHHNVEYSTIKLQNQQTNQNENIKLKKVRNYFSKSKQQLEEGSNGPPSSSTMPAMPKELSTISSLSDDNEKYSCNNKESMLNKHQRVISSSSSPCSSSSSSSSKLSPLQTAKATTASSNNEKNAYIKQTTNIQNNITNGCCVTQQEQQQSQISKKKRGVNDFRFGKSIGEGSFSTVYIAKDIHTNKEYAIKVCDKQHIIRERKNQYIIREREAMNVMSGVPGFVSLYCTFQDTNNLYFAMTYAQNVKVCDKQHIIRERKNQYIIREREAMNVMSGVPGFVSLYCTFQDTNNLYFAMTYAQNGDVLPYINKVGSFDLECTKFYAAELVLALEDMHSRGVIHRDLKPENILLDDKMHSLIADFGSAKILNTENNEIKNNDINNKEINNMRLRKNSFVGTAQYVSPELLKGHITTKSSDLWALGCIIYQMISGLPPFRAMSEYLIFQNILKLDLQFPDGFDEEARDLVKQLLVIEPELRIGANDCNDIYDSIRMHPFFNGIEWKNLRSQTPPQIYPYLPGDELRSHYRIPDHLEPGLDDKQLQRLLGLELGTSDSGEPIVVPKKSIADLQENEKELRLENQKIDKYNQFVDGEVILKHGLVNKRKGLFARKRMLLLTTGPRLIYVDPVSMVKKGEIPWSPELRVEPKNFKIFFIHTPNRTYYLEEPEGYALNWCRDIEDVRLFTYEHDS